MTDVAPAPMDLVTDVINGWSETVRVEGDYTGVPYPALSAVLESHGWRSRPVRTERLAALGDRLHRVFAPAPVSHRLTELDGLIAGLRPLPVVSTAGPRWRIDDAARSLEAALVFGLTEYARDDPELTRLGQCEAHRCVFAFVDLTQAGTRRYCSIACQNRVKAAAHRARARRQGRTSR